MTNQTQSALAMRTWDDVSFVVSSPDREILRRLASKVAELAARPIEDEKRDLWYRHNQLEPTRPLIFCDPENGWNEIITENQLKCSGSLARDWEMLLRKEIFWGESMRDDRVIEPYFTLPYVYEESDWGMHETKIGGGGGCSYTWDAPLKSYDDMHKLHYPRITADYEKTDTLRSLAAEMFGDILPVRIKGTYWWTLGMTWTLVTLRGLQEIMFDCYDHPDELQEMMGFLRDGTMAKLDFLQDNGLLSLNNDGTYVGSGGFGWTSELPQKDFDGSKVRTQDMWGFGESQETNTWSPAMFEEFIFPYQRTILERFGLNCYGCCEPVDKRWHIIETIPRLRRVSVSPWSNIEAMAEKLGDRYIYSMKPIPSDLALPTIDEDYIRTNLRRAITVCRDCHLEIIMKDNHTLGNNPDNAIRWCRIAREEAESQ